MMGGEGCIHRVPLKRRPRFANGRAYTDKATKADEAAVRAAYRGPKFSGPVKVRIYVYKPLQKAANDDEWWPFVQKPDVDNIAKAVLDGLNGVAYDDDAQVIDLQVMKQNRGYEEDAREPWCMFYVFAVEDYKGREPHVQ